VTTTNDGRYPSVATYTCKAGYMTTNATTRSCLKSGAWSGQIPVCVDFDECAAGTSTCDNRTSCENTVGSYKCGPYLIDDTIDVIEGGSSNETGRIMVDSTAGGAVISMEFERGDIPVTGVTYRSTLTSRNACGGIIPGPISTCVDWSISAHPTVSTRGVLTCTTTAGFGKLYHFTLEFCGSSCHNTSLGRDILDYASPAFVPKTLRHAGTGLFTEHLNLPDNSAYYVVMDMVNFIVDPERVIVYYGPLTKPQLYQCEVDTARSNVSTLTCMTEAASYGSSLAFSLHGLGEYASTTDMISYPTPVAPDLFSVSGCEYNGNNATFECPTTGRTIITLTGLNFFEPLAVFVGSAECPTYPVTTPGVVECILPPGSGSNVGVMVSSQGYFSRPYPVLSYAQPVITSIEGCEDRGSDYELLECNREGGDVITLTGYNFGESLAQVLIGTSQCENVEHDPISPHEKLTCTLPTGNRLSQSVLLVQFGGSLSSQPVSVSYKQCLPGHWEEGFMCLPCPLGRFSSGSGMIVCEECAAGSYAGDEGSTQCYLCDTGSFQSESGHSTCVECDKGMYAISTGKTECNLCAAGRFAAENGTTECERCSSGSAQDSLGASFCFECAPGYFSSLNGSYTCTSCGAGSYSNVNASTQCSGCTAGTYQRAVAGTTCAICKPGWNSLNNAAECVACEPGRFAAEQGTMTCNLCAAGTFSVSAGTVCFDCPAGSYSRSGDSYCASCEPGKFASNASSTICDLCSPNTYQDEAGRDNCKSCRIGESSSEGARLCVLCPEGYYTSQAGCQQCPEMSRSNGDKSDCLCAVGYYGMWVTSRATGTSSIICRACPVGANCKTTGVTWETIQVETGYWRTSNESTDFYRCLRPEHCLGGASECSDNRSGPLCATCLPGYIPSSVDGKCSACPDQTKAWWSSALICLAVAVGVCILYYLALRGGDSQASPAVERVSPLDVRMEDLDEDRLDQHIAQLYASKEQREPPNVMFNLKIALGFLQISTRILDIVNAQWPSYFSTFVSYFNVVNFDFIPWETVGCVTTINFYIKLMIMMLVAPVVITFVSLLFSLGIRCADRYDMADDDTMRNRRQRYRQMLWRVILFTLFLIYPSMSAKVLSMFVCYEVDNVSYLRVDFNLLCFDSQWYTYMPYAIAGVAVYPVGIPLFFFAILRLYRNKLQEPGTIFAFGFLYKAFNENMWFFEMVDMFFKIMLTSVIAFLPDTWQLPFGMAVTVCYMSMILMRSPYIRAQDDRMHLFALTEIVLLLMCGYILQRPEPFDYAIDVALSVIFITLTICVILLFVYHGALFIKSEYQARERAKLLAQTKVASSVIEEQHVADDETGELMLSDFHADDAHFTADAPGANEQEDETNELDERRARLGRMPSFIMDDGQIESLDLPEVEGEELEMSPIST